MHKKKVLIAFAISFSVSSFFFQCNFFKLQKTYKIARGELFRFIDHLSEENVVQTPLKDLIKNFKLVEEELTGKWAHVPELSNDNYDVWGVSTKYPVFETSGMTLLKNGKEIKFCRDDEKQKGYWKWVKTKKNMKLNNFKNFNAELKGIIIRKGDPLEMTVFLPDGDVSLFIEAINRCQKDAPPLIKVSLNGKIIEEIPVLRTRFHHFRDKVRLGKYKLKLECIDPINSTASKNGNAILIRKVKILTGRDIILLYKLKNDPASKSLSKNYKVKYHTFHSENYEEPIKQAIVKLYELKNSFGLNDFNIKKNPYNIKKKVQFQNSMLNVLLSPPESEYQFKLKIPPKATLEFGCGFFETNWKISEKGVTFEVLIEDGKERKKLFFKHLNPYLNQKDRELFTKKIDLSDFENKTIKISFLTKIDSKENKVNATPSFWYNPIIYSPSYSKEKDINVVLISIDTLRPDHLSCYGYPRKTSPSIDQLAKDGLMFLNCYSTTSWTLPAHISLLTSLNSVHHRVYFPKQIMDKELITLSDILRNHNFLCAAFTGGGYLSARYGFAKGFDMYNEIIRRIPLRYNEAEMLFENVSSWITQNRDKNFFLFLHTYQVHNPYENYSSIGKIFLDENHKWEKVNMGHLFKNKEENRYLMKFTKEEKENIIALYDGEIRYTDEYLIKPILNLLKTFNLYNRTLIILTSDHGEEFYDHEAWLHQHSLYNETIKIPLIIKFPHSKFKGKRISNIVRIIDIMPTILDYFDIEHSTFRLDGESLMNLIEGNGKKNRVFISDLALIKYKDVYPTIIAINNGTLKLILNKRVISPYIEKVSTVLKGYNIELYDTKNDPDEKINLADKMEYREQIFDLIKFIEYYYNISETKEVKEITINKELRERLRALGYIK